MSEIIKSSAVVITFNNEKKTRKRSNHHSRDNVQRKPKMSKEELDKRLTDSLIRAIERDGGKYIKFNADQYGMLVGGVRERGGDGKLYFVWIDNDRNVQLNSTYDTYNLLYDSLVRLSILDYVVKTDRMYILNKLDAWFEQNEDKYSKVTDFILPHRRSSRNNNRKFKKRRQ